MEKRRKSAYEEAQKDLSVNHTGLVIDRYKFMDLMPCSGDQLKLMGYNTLVSFFVSSLTTLIELTFQKGQDNVNGAVSSGPKVVSTRGPQAASAIMGGAGGHSDVAKYGFPRPDISQMIPFKPRVNCTASFHPVPGGVYPPPPAVAHLMSLLPPPTSFIGPFVNVDMLCNLLSQTPLPTTSCKQNLVFQCFKNKFSDAKSDDNMIGPMLEQDIKKDMYQLLATTSDPSAVSPLLK